MPVIKKPQNTRKPWAARWQAEGRQRERSFVTKREATDFLTSIEHSKRANTYADPKLSGVTFWDYAETWISRRPSPATMALYRGTVTRYGKPLDGRTLAQVAADREGVQACLDAAPAGTRDVLRSVIIGSVNEAMRAGRITSHRLSRLTVPQASKRAEFHAITPDELDKLAIELGPVWGLLAQAQAALGLRIGEALALRAEDFRNGGTTVRITRQRRADNSVGPLKMKMDGDFRDVPVPGWLWAQVEGRTGDLFPVENRTTTTARFSRACRLTGLPAGYRPHDLRHSFASVMLGAGVPVTDVARYLGHADIRITFAVYSHLVPDSADRARDVMTAWAA